jgi:toxin-antitoxin system PIN domain toxin
LKRALLDVNVLVALLDPDHVHHARAREWLAGRSRAGWASCPITQNGCIRVMSLPAYGNPLPAAAVIERLALAARHPSHEFWPADISVLDPGFVKPSRVHGPRQVTDLYLLALAVNNDGCFVTFDARVPLNAVPSARPEHLILL